MVHQWHCFKGGDLTDRFIQSSRAVRSEKFPGSNLQLLVEQWGILLNHYKEVLAASLIL